MILISLSIFTFKSQLIIEKSFEVIMIIKCFPHFSSDCLQIVNKNRILLYHHLLLINDLEIGMNLIIFAV